jgi:phage terminase large subunit-like protein
MTESVALDDSTLQRWRANPTSFVEEVLHDPETGRPFVLLEAERAFMRHAFALDSNGRLLYPELLYGAPKKSGKTTLAALIVLVMVLLRSDGRFSEAYVCANDFEQAQSRVFTVCRRIVEASPSAVAPRGQDHG